MRLPGRGAGGWRTHAGERNGVLARKALRESDVGAERVDALLRRFVAQKPSFPSPVLATSLIPIADFIELNERIVRELYDGDTMSYGRFGRQSGEWALTQGPYRRMREEKSLDELIASAPSLYRNYFTEGRARSSRDASGAIHLFIEGIAPQYRHAYFEYGIVGYFERGLELVGGQPVTHTRLAGFSAGDDHVHYRFG